MIERIFYLMKERGVNDKKLIFDLGFANGVVTEWRKGRSKPSTDAIIKIAEYFGVTTDYLLTGKKFYKTEKENEKMDNNFDKQEFEAVKKYIGKKIEHIIIDGRLMELSVNVSIPQETLKEWSEGVFNTEIIIRNISDIARWINDAYPQAALLFDYVIRMNRNERDRQVENEENRLAAKGQDVITG